MKPEAQIIALAKLEGYRAERWESGCWVCYDPEGNRCDVYTGSEETAWLRNVPDYLNDLNAIQRIQLLLDDDEWDRYLCNLATVVEARTCWKTSEADPRSFAIATAAQRAEALLRTKWLWTDDVTDSP